MNEIFLICYSVIRFDFISPNTASFFFRFFINFLDKTIHRLIVRLRSSSVSLSASGWLRRKCNKFYYFLSLGLGRLFPVGEISLPSHLFVRIISNYFLDKINRYRSNHNSKLNMIYFNLRKNSILEQLCWDSNPIPLRDSSQKSCFVNLIRSNLDRSETLSLPSGPCYLDGHRKFHLEMLKKKVKLEIKISLQTF